MTSERSRQTTLCIDPLAGGGDMGALMRSIDWAKTPVGPVEEWPLSLKLLLRVLLDCRLPMYLAWGNEFTQFYNDAYRPILGKKHPEAMGISAQKTWPEIWPTIGPMWAEVWNGQSFGFDNFMLTIERFGYPENCYFNFSYSPVPDDSGKVGGVLVTFAETTEKVLSEQRLLREREKLTSTLRQAPVGIAVLEGPDHVFVMANPTYYSLLFGGDRGFVGKPVREAVPEAVTQGFVDLLDRVYETGEPFVGLETPIELLQADGTWKRFYLNFVYQPLRDRENAVQGIVGVVTDVTEQVVARKHAEEALARDRFIIRLDHEIRPLIHPYEIMQTAARLLGEHLDVNRCAYADVEEDEDTFNLTGDYIRGVRSIVGRYTFTDFSEKCLRLMRADRPYIVEDSETDPRCTTVVEAYRRTAIRAVVCVPLHKAGRFVAAMAVHTSQPRSWRVDEVELVKTVAARCWESIERARALRDIRRAEDVLRAREQQLQLITDTAPVYIAQCDMEGFYKFVNQRYAERLGLRAEECIGKRMADVLSLDVYESFRRHVDAALAGKSVRFEVDIPSERGQRTLLCAYVPERQIDGTVNGLVAVMSDITDRVEAEQALRRLNDELERRVEDRTREVVASQEQLRALASELNLTEQRERKRVATELHDHLQQLLVLCKLKLGQGKRLAQAIPACVDIISETDHVLTDALEYTRSLVAELSPPVLREHGLAAALKWLGEYMKRHDMHVTVLVPSGDQLRLPEDQALLVFQSVRELLMNAWKHAGTAEAVVRLEQQQHQLSIQVHDRGAGFDIAAAGGTEGMRTTPQFGLFSIRERMKALGGTFRLESAPAKGTTATLVLPLGPAIVRDEHAVPAHNDNSRLQQKGALPDIRDAVGRNKRRVGVLLVDDHAMVRQGLRSVLEAYADIEVVGEAVNGEEAVELTGRLQPAIVVMDINMPRMNGIEATTRIRGRHPDIQVIGLSVNAEGNNVQAMTKAGAAMLLTKEAAVEELYRAIQQTLSNL